MGSLLLAGNVRWFIAVLVYLFIITYNMDSAMQHLPDLTGILPDIPTYSDIDMTYWIVGGVLLLSCLLVPIVIKRWKNRSIQNTPIESHGKTTKQLKSQGAKNIQTEETEKCKTNKLTSPSSKTSIQKSEVKSQPGWLGGISGTIASVKKEITIEKENKSEEKEKGWFSFSKEADTKKKDVTVEKDSFMKPINLNIDHDAPPREVTKQKTEKQMQLVRKMCGEFREVVKLENKDDREEKRKEMEKVRSARTYFKSVDKYRSESLSCNQRIKFKTE